VNPLTATQRDRMRSTTEATFEELVTRRRFPMVRDRYNVERRDTAAPLELAGIPAALWQERSSEDRDDRERQIEQWLGRVPVGTDVTGADVIVAAAGTFEVVGPPLDARTHLRLELRIVDG